MSCFLCHLVLGVAHGLFVVCGFWGLFCFGLPGFWLLWLGVGWGYVVWFSGLFLTVALAWLHALLCGVGWGLLVLFGEFDPGSGRTLAACLTHASRTVKGPACWFWMSGERVSNT